MSHPASASASPSRFQSIFDSALDAYKKRANQDLASHPLLTRLQSCDSADAILTLLQDQLPVRGQSEGADDGLAKLLMPTLNVLYAFSATLAEGVGIVNTSASSWDFCADIFSSGILSFEGYLYGHRNPLPGLRLLRFVLRAVLTLKFSRQPKTQEIAKTS
jgi:hypothetical protein